MPSLVLALALVSQDPTALAERFSAMTAVSGYEQAVVDSILALLPNARRDRAGSAVVTLGSGSPRRVAVCALDETGYVVGNVRDDGYLTVRRVGAPPSRLWDQGHEGHRITVWGDRGPVPAVVAIPSTHLTRGRSVDFSSPFTSDDVLVELGAASPAEVAELGIDLLAPVALLKRPHRYGSMQLAAPNAARRSACAALAHAAMSNARPRGTVVAVFAVESRIRHRGLLTAMHTAGPFDETLLLGYDASDRLLAEGFGAVTRWDVNAKYAATPVETVNLRDVAALAERVRMWIAAGDTRASGPTPSVSAPSMRTVPAAAPATTPTPSATPIYRASVILRDLIETYGVSGDESRVREKIAGHLPAWATPQTDSAGNLWVRVGRGDPVVVFVAHMDETGYRVERIEPDGSLVLGRRGGFLPWLWEATNALVHTTRGPVAGVFMPRADVGDRPGRMAPGDVKVDVGAGDAAGVERMGIRVGDAVTNPKEYQPLYGQRVTARSFDDRVGSAAQILALHDLDRSKLDHEVIFLWVVREEIGLEGAFVAARELGTRAVRVHAVDTFVAADNPLDPQNFAVTPIGAGPVARMVDNSSVTPPAVVDTLVALAKRHRIPLQVGTTNGGNDGSAFTAWGVVDVPIGWPLRYSHSPVETIDLRDLVELARLVRVIAEEW